MVAFLLCLLLVNRPTNGGLKMGNIILFIICLGVSAFILPAGCITVYFLIDHVISN